MEAPKTALHHWWPKGLSKYWRDEDESVGCMKSDGSSFRTQNFRLGGIRNAHSHRYTEEWGDSPWNQSLEGVFQTVDDIIPRIVREISFESEGQVAGWTSFQASDWIKDNLAPFLASLCMRSPRTRYLASRLGRELTGFERHSRTDLNVSLSNAIAGFKAYSQSLPGRGKFGILRAMEGEFIYGDGFYHNLEARGDVVSYPRMLVPLTPTVAVIFCRPSSYFTEPMFSETFISKEEVDRLNDLVQVHSERFLFYRSISPKIHAAFSLGEYRTVTPQSNPAIRLMDSLLDVRVK